MFKGSRLGRILVDLNTQRDFLDPRGMMPVRNIEDVSPQLHRVTQLADQAGLSIIASLETHHLSDSVFGIPLHCIENTDGQEKMPFTLMVPHTIIEANNTFDLPYNLMSEYQQIIFRKQDADFFNNPKADRLLTELQPTEFLVYGVAAERAVKAVALGLLARHKKVAVIADACGFWSEADADLCLRQMAAKGIRITTVQEFTDLVESARRRVRVRMAKGAAHRPRNGTHKRAHIHAATSQSKTATG